MKGTYTQIDLLSLLAFSGLDCIHLTERDGLPSQGQTDG